MPIAPFEMVSGPLTLYLAPEGTAAPEISATPPAAWVQFGQSGARNYSEDGVVVTPEQELSTQRVLGSTAAAKVFRVNEDVMISVTVLDLHPSTFARALNNQTITQTSPASGVAGRRDVSLLRGREVDVYALVAKGFSPIGDGFEAQFWFPRAYTQNVGAATYIKGQAAGFALETRMLEDLTDGFGLYMVQDADPI